MKANDRYEISASVFYYMTGVMAPGKDISAAAGAVDETERRQLWQDWCDAHLVVVNATINAMIRSKDKTS